jgi:hypothetical protein
VFKRATAPSTVKPVTTNAPSGNMVLGNEVITTVIKKGVKRDEQRIIPAQKAPTYMAGLLLLLVMAAGWVVQGKNTAPRTGQVMYIIE